MWKNQRRHPQRRSWPDIQDAHRINENSADKQKSRGGNAIFLFLSFIFLIVWCSSGCPHLSSGDLTVSGLHPEGELEAGPGHAGVEEVHRVKTLPPHSSNIHSPSGSLFSCYNLCPFWSVLVLVLVLDADIWTNMWRWRFEENITTCWMQDFQQSKSKWSLNL